MTWMVDSNRKRHLSNSSHCLDMTPLRIVHKFICSSHGAHMWHMGNSYGSNVAEPMFWPASWRMVGALLYLFHKMEELCCICFAIWIICWRI